MSKRAADISQSVEYQMGYRDGYLEGQSAGLKIAQNVLATSTQPIVIVGESLLREPVTISDLVEQLSCKLCSGPLNACYCLPPLVVTRDGEVCADQKAAREEFFRACEPTAAFPAPEVVKCQYCNHNNAVNGVCQSRVFLSASSGDRACRCQCVFPSTTQPAAKK